MAAKIGIKLPTLQPQIVGWEPACNMSPRKYMSENSWAQHYECFISMVLTMFFSKCHEYPLTSMPASLTSNVTRHQNNIQHPDFRPNPNIDVTTRNSKRRALVFFCSSKRPLAKDSGALSRGEVSWGLPGAVFLLLVEINRFNRLFYCK